ncbi:MAG: hypothetical protein AAF702_24210 [Chloroflexota bacterium]
MNRTTDMILSIFVLLAIPILGACVPLQPMSEPLVQANDDIEQEATGQTATEFEAIDVACADGNILLSEEPLLAGRSQVEVNQEVGEEYFQVNALYSPTAYPDSTWVLPGEGFATPDGSFIVIHRGHGTGRLEGARMLFTASPAEDVPDDLPCEPVGPLVKLEGIVIHPDEATEFSVEHTITATEFEAIDVACADGNTLLSEEPLVAGQSEVEVNQEVGEIYFQVNATYTPTAYSDSTWELPGEGFATPDGRFIVIHRGHGTGSLAGSKMLFTASPAAEEPDDLPCEPVGPLVKLEGIIIHPEEYLSWGNSFNSDGNLLKNASFEQDPQTSHPEWLIDSRGADLVAEWTTERAKTGTHALALTTGSSAEAGWPGWFTTIPLDPEQNYKFQVSAYSPPPGAGLWVSLEFLDAQGNRIGDENADCWTFGTRPGIDLGMWIDIAGYYSTKANADSQYIQFPSAEQVRIGLRQCLTLTEGEATTLYYDDIYFGIKAP